MTEREALIAEIRALSQRLDSREVSFYEVAVATASIMDRPLKAQVGQRPTEADPETLDALGLLGESIYRAFSRDMLDIPTITARNIGYGTARGFLGIDFFKNLRKK